MGAEIGIGIRSGIIHIELERPCIITIIPITAEIGTITGIKIGIICCFFLLSGHFPFSVGEIVGGAERRSLWICLPLI